jgi:hypothetical protein
MATWKKLMSERTSTRIPRSVSKPAFIGPD